MVYKNLEQILGFVGKSSSERKQEYRSKSEGIVADVLEKNGLRFSYEDRTYVEAKGSSGDVKGRLVYPDFHLEDLGIVLEFAGRYKGESEKEYSNRIEQKKELYEDNGVKVVWIYPEDVWDSSKNYKKLREDYEENIIKKIKSTLIERGKGDRREIEVPAYRYAA